MTPHLFAEKTPLSMLTAASLKDLGYKVDLTSGAIDAFDAQKSVKAAQGRVGAVRLENCINRNIKIKLERRTEPSFRRDSRKKPTKRAFGSTKQPFAQRI